MEFDIRIRTKTLVSLQVDSGRTRNKRRKEEIITSHTYSEYICGHAIYIRHNNDVFADAQFRNLLHTPNTIALCIDYMSYDRYFLCHDFAASTTLCMLGHSV